MAQSRGTIWPRAQPRAIPDSVNKTHSHGPQEHFSKSHLSSCLRLTLPVRRAAPQCPKNSSFTPSPQKPPLLSLHPPPWLSIIQIRVALPTSGNHFSPGGEGKLITAAISLLERLPRNSTVLIIGSKHAKPGGLCELHVFLGTLFPVLIRQPSS